MDLKHVIATDPAVMHGGALNCSMRQSSAHFGHALGVIKSRHKMPMRRTASAGVTIGMPWYCLRSSK